MISSRELEDRVADLERIYVLRSLPPEELRALAREAERVRYPAGRVILRQGGPPSRYLYLISAGTVHVEAGDPRRPDAAPQLVDVCTEGEVFGAASLLDEAPDARARFTTRVVEDATCYLLPRERVRRLVEQYPAVADSLAVRNHRLLRRATTELATRRDGAPLAAGLDLGLRVLLDPVGERVRRAAVACRPETPIAEAARAMTEAGISSILVEDAEGRPVGIVTDSDLRRRVVAERRDASAPVASVMSRPVLTLGRDAPALDALRLLTDHGINHLVVVGDSGRAVGLLTTGDLLLPQGHSPVAVLRAMESASDIDELAAARSRMTELLDELMRVGVEPAQATRVITALNDRATRRALAWAESAATAELGDGAAGFSPPRYCWLALGSEGRQEQTLATDQDNALIHAAAPGDERAHRWLERFGVHAREHLERLGFPRCPGDVMVSNPHWRRPLEGWRQQIRRWMDVADEQAMLESTIFFDFRAIHGETAFAHRLRETVRTEIPRNDIFLAHLTRAALRNRPPLGLIRTFVVERSGEHRDTFNLKERGMAPLVDAARVLALGHGIDATNTFDRLAAAAEARAISRELAEDAREAYGFLMLVRIQHHLALQAAGKPPNNHVNPNELSALQRRTLKVAFQVVQAVQGALTERFGGYPL